MGSPVANPLIVGKRPQYESDCLDLIRKISDATGLMGEEVVAKASFYKGQSRLNPTTMTDDRLLHTIRELRAWVGRLQPSVVHEDYFAGKDREHQEFLKRGAENLAKLKERL